MSPAASQLFLLSRRFSIGVASVERGNVTTSRFHRVDVPPR